jgi:hypothetical protein
MSGRRTSTDRYMLALMVGALFCYLAPDLGSQTMALDGLAYANVAKLLASGEGSFWALPYFDLSVPVFYDHPPLGIAIMQWWMQLFGLGFWAEKLLAAVTILVVIGLLMLLIQVTRSAQVLPVPTWWVVTAFVLMPTSTYVLKNNFLDSLLLVPTLVGVICGWLAWKRKAYAILLGISALVAVLIKGPMGLFTIAAVPAGLWWYHARFVGALQIGAIASAAFVIGIALIALTNPASFEFASHYFEDQVIASIVGDRPAEHGRLYLIGQLSLNLLVSGVVLFAAIRTFKAQRLAGFWLTIALAAALPLLISARQYRHYLLPALPFFALALASLIPAPAVRPTQWLPAASIAACVAALVAMLWWFGSAGDHAETIGDSDVIAGQLAGKSVGYCRDDRSLLLRAYLYRRHGVKSSPGGNERWALCAENPGESKRVDLDLKARHTLWLKQ